jgi:DNA-binding transcriptional regulator of glucitol operon
LPFVYCVPLPDSSGRFAETGVSLEGNFQVQLAPGVYRVLAFDRSQELEYQNAEAMRAYEGKGPVIRLAPGQSEHVRVTLISSAE